MKIIHLVKHMNTDTIGEIADFLPEEDRFHYTQVSSDFHEGITNRPFTTKSINVARRYDKASLVLDHLDYNTLQLLQGIEHKVVRINKSNLKDSYSEFINLKYLDCSHSLIVHLDYLPSKLETLICSNNVITSLDYLPRTLKYLDCSYNRLKSVHHLPIGLEYLNISGNGIIDLSYLPDKLNVDNIAYGMEYIDCSNNDLTQLDLSNNSIDQLCM